MSKWISVKDRLPSKVDDYLVAFQTKGFGRKTLEVSLVWYYEDGWDLENIFEPIAWQPLPEPPKEEE